MEMKYFALFAFLFIGTALSQDQITEPPAPETIDIQPQNILNATTDLLKKKCEEIGTSGDRMNTLACLTRDSFINDLISEMDKESASGQVEEVAKGYCSKVSQLNVCYKNVSEAVEPCFSDKEKANLKTVVNVTEQLGEFLCEKDGDRVALFLAEGGRDCYKSKRKELQACFNGTFLSGFRDGELRVTFGEKECNQLKEIERCVVTSLESCPEPTTANMTESLFKFLRRANFCKDAMITKHEKHSNVMSDKAKPDMNAQHSDASGLALATATIFTALSAVLLV